MYGFDSFVHRLGRIKSLGHVKRPLLMPDRHLSTSNQRVSHKIIQGVLKVDKIASNDAMLSVHYFVCI